MANDSLTPKQELVQKVKDSQHILLAISKRPSGDQVGSLLALARGLENLGKNVFLVAGSRVPDNYNFLLKGNEINQGLEGSKDFILELDSQNAQPENLGYKMEEGKLKITITPSKGNFKPDDVSYSYGDYQFDLIITLGVSELKQLGKIYRDNPDIFYKTSLANIDQKKQNENFGKINWLDKGASSLSEMMVSLLEALEISLDEDLATPLLAAIMSATDRFQASNTSSKSLTVAAQLTGAGGKREEIVKNLFQTTPYFDLKGWGRVIENLSIDPTLKLAWSSLTKEEIEKLKITSQAINQGLNEILTQVEEADLIGLVQETDEGVKISLRSKGDLTVDGLAQEYEGGGRPQAAGFDLKGDDFNELKNKALRILKNYQKERL